MGSCLCCSVFKMSANNTFDGLDEPVRQKKTPTGQRKSQKTTKKEASPLRWHVNTPLWDVNTRLVRPVSVRPRSISHTMCLVLCIAENGPTVYEFDTLLNASVLLNDLPMNIVIIISFFFHAYVVDKLFYLLQV